MKTTVKFIFSIVLFSAIIGSCSKSKNMVLADEVMEMSMIDIPKEYDPVNAQQSIRLVPPVIQNYIATSAATVINDDENHKFIRTATLKFKVKDVVSATSVIEDIIIKNKGFIIRSAINNKQSVLGEYDISDDSLLTIVNNHLEGNLNLKVPCELLNKALREIAPIAVHIDYRTIEAEDVTVKLLSDKLEQERMAKKQRRMGNVIDRRSGRLEEATDAEERMDSSLEQADRAYISTFTTNERIAYSVININVYQEPVTERIVTPVDYYKPGFGSKITDGLSTGWNILCAIFLFFVNIWPITLIIIGIIILLYFRLSGNRKKNN